MVVPFLPNIPQGEFREHRDLAYYAEPLRDEQVPFRDCKEIQRLSGEPLDKPLYGIGYLAPAA